MIPMHKVVFTSKSLDHLRFETNQGQIFLRLRNSLFPKYFLRLIQNFDLWLKLYKSVKIIESFVTRQIVAGFTNNQ